MRISRKFWATFLLLVLLAALTHAQNVGVGTTSPTHKLHVVDTVRLESYGAPDSALIIVDQQGVLNILPFIGDTSKLLRGDGQWKTASASDNWGNQTAITSFPIIGDGTTAQPITLNPGGTNNDILIWNGTQWTIAPMSSGISGTNVLSLCPSMNVNSLLRFTGTNACNSLLTERVLRKLCHHIS